jgi:phospholipid transport system substrate-binding protein
VKYPLGLGALGLALAVGLLLAVPVLAMSPLESTRATLEQARAIVASDRPHNDKLAELNALFQTFLDTDAMGRAALGRRWSSFTPVQQREFLTLFRELLQRTYVQKLLLFEHPNFAYVAEHRHDDQARVDTKIVTPRDEFAVVYELRAVGERWLATEVRVEDVSLTANLGSQLDRVLSRSTVDDLLSQLRRKYGTRQGTASQ